MDRRDFVKSVPGIFSLSVSPFGFSTATLAETSASLHSVNSRVRPGDADWPLQAQWIALSNSVGGRLVKLDDPLAACRVAPHDDACAAFFQALHNPYFISDDPELTETSGWLDAWSSAPSAYAVKAQSTEDVVAAVNFARENKLRLVVKGGGHSYQGTSDSVDSLLIWTRNMGGITIRENFIPRGCAATQEPQPAVTVETGARWYSVYQAVTTGGGRYVQGGGCATVGVAGFIHGGGFGSFSKKYGLGAAALLEAEIVTADGGVLVINAGNHPDLFWAVRGGGGGSFGVLTKLTLRTRELPATFGGINLRVKASSTAAFQALVAQAMQFYADILFNPVWGEQITFGADNTMAVSMRFQGIEQAEAEAMWKPFMNFIADAPKDFAIESPLEVYAMPAQHYWDPEYTSKHFPTHAVRDDRPGAPSANVYTAGDAAQVGFFCYGYTSAWMPASLLTPEGMPKLVDAIVAATRKYGVSFHFNKGLAGAPQEEIEAARKTAMNPAVLDAFALVIIAGGEPPAFAGITGHEPDLARARGEAKSIQEATDALLKVAPGAGSYLSEADYFDPNWKQSYWGANFDRLIAVKKRYDPDGLFFVHHGVGSDEWSPDGFTRLA